MISAEPPRTQYDLNFMLAGVPVRIHPFFWLAGLLLGLRGGEPIEGASPQVLVLIWILAMFVSILVHEMGHALTIRYFGWKPRVVLYHFGGLAIWDPSEAYSYSHNPHEESPRTKILIALAGPGAGFLLAALVVGLCYAAGRPIEFSLGGPLGFRWLPLNFSNPKAFFLISDLVFINLFWGLINLLPVFPLDGGQVARELFSRYSAYDGMAKSLRLSMVVAAVVAVVALVRLEFRDGLFIAVLFGLLAYASYAALQSLRGGGYGGSGGYGEDRGW